MIKSNYDKTPYIDLGKENIWSGWEAIIRELQKQAGRLGTTHKVIVIETYTGVLDNEVLNEFHKLPHDKFISTKKLFKSEKEIEAMTFPDVTDDEIFGYMTRLNMQDFFDPYLLEQQQKEIATGKEGTVIIYGHGASLLAEKPDLLIYLDMPRLRIQQRMRKNLVHGLGVDDSTLRFTFQYKRGFFVDWRVCDRLKQRLFDKIDFVLDTTLPGNPKMIESSVMLNGFEKTVTRPFRVAPFFEPGPWGGQWMREVCDIDGDEPNYAWCFDCVPEENSLLYKISGVLFELPSINLVFTQSTKLLGEPVESRFGKEFPIRFDFLDTMDGGNLSFQVHPTTQYIREAFGMHYTQDESYYLLDAGDDATVYLGLKNGIDPQEMLDDLREAREGKKDFDVEKFANKWPAKKHDHFLIPNGTCHCSGKNSMVLEISSTPYIFTFKLWDWGRLGLDGRPRPINIEHGKNVINWSRDTDYTRANLINHIEEIANGDGWKEERTGLNENEFIETRRHWFTKKVAHKTNQSVNVLNLEGREAIVESPNGAFEPFIVHYAETFIVPSQVKDYTIRPYGESEGKEVATIKAYIRFKS
ncbi:MAG: mannose-6-phosphate isomerase [Chlorobi bacterium]|nr:mannose-6-phosphate isomerase [Chlorobiota bacterium]